MEKKVVIVLTVLSLTVVGICETWRLGSDQHWQKVADANAIGSQLTDDSFGSAASEAKQFASSGNHGKAKKAYANLKKNYPQISGPDYDAYVKAELFYAKRKYAKAAAAYSDLLEKYPESSLRQAALEREYQIGSAFLHGQKRTVLGIFKLHAYEEGTEIMTKIADIAGDAPIAKKAIETLARSREKRGAYDEAYLAWADYQNRWPTGETGKESLLGMARSLEQDYKGPKFDGKVLESSKSYYSEYAERYPESAQQFGLTDKVEELESRLAEKELLTADYYAKTESYAAADIYYQKIIDQWPDTVSAQKAQEKLPQIKKLLVDSQVPKKKKFNWKGLFL
ncbi:MAG: Outer membrane protein assembly factor BamD [Planctomycetes bacterium ADurb.Bin401]|nr:MAG: Outer membrane protein assembly factor BamD [Planctomycetes bacterium ADurb.Bin401]